MRCGLTGKDGRGAYYSVGSGCAAVTPTSWPHRYHHQVSSNMQPKPFSFRQTARSFFSTSSSNPIPTGMSYMEHNIVSLTNSFIKMMLMSSPPHLSRSTRQVMLRWVRSKRLWLPSKWGVLLRPTSRSSPPSLVCYSKRSPCGMQVLPILPHITTHSDNPVTRK